MSQSRRYSKVLPQQAPQREEQMRTPAAERSPQPAAPARENAYLAMHRTIGNQAMQRMLAQRSPAARERVIQRGLLDDAWDAATDFASDAADTVSDTASSAWDTVTETAGAVGEAVSETAGNAWDRVTETAGAVGEAVSDTAGSAWNRVTGAAGRLLDRAGERVNDIWQGVQGVAGRIWEGAGRVWEAASESTRQLFTRVVEAAQRVGGIAQNVLARLANAGEAVLTRILEGGAAALRLLQRVGGLALDVLERVGQTLFEKAMFYADVFWSFISNIPDRLWRLVIDGWEGLQGMASWLGAGFSGLLDWLRSGLSGAADWAIAFIQSPSLDALADGVRRFLRQVGSGAMGALRWVWDGISSGAMWALRVALHLLELLGLGEFLSALWGTIFHLRPLDASEIGASSAVHGGGQVPYNIVWVDEGSLVARISNAFTGGRTEAVTTMHILHLPHAGVMSGELAVHELTHVAQYEKVGGIYMAQAVHAQIAGSQYDYGNLTGKHFRELDREAQAELCGDYYKVGGDGADATRTHRSRGGSVNSIGTIRALISEMRGGAY